jgi:hypothetical protein
VAAAIAAVYVTVLVVAREIDARDFALLRALAPKRRA